MTDEGMGGGNVVVVAGMSEEECMADAMIESANSEKIEAIMVVDEGLSFRVCGRALHQIGNFYCHRLLIIENSY